MKNVQYRKYKKVFQIDINIIEKFIKQCDGNINLVKEYVKNQIYQFMINYANNINNIKRIKLKIFISLKL